MCNDFAGRDELDPGTELNLGGDRIPDAAAHDTRLVQIDIDIQLVLIMTVHRRDRHGLNGDSGDIVLTVLI